MIFSFLNRQKAADIKLGLPFLSKALFLGILGTLCLNPAAKAADSITLQYGDETRTFETDNIRAFIQSGQAADPELQSFFQRAPEARRLLQEILSAEIYISPSFVSRIEQGLQSPTGDFVLIQLNKLVSTPTASEDLEPLRTALVNAFEDDSRFSLLEVIQQYPAADVQLNLTGLEPVYNDVKGFVERVLPALEVAREYLQDIICDCESTPTAQTGTSQGSTVPASAQQAVKCIDQAKSTIQTETAAQVSTEQELADPLSNTVLSPDSRQR